MRAGEKLISSGASVNHSLQRSDGFYVQFKEKTNMIIERKLTVFPALCTTNVLCIYAVLHLACTNIYCFDGSDKVLPVFIAGRRHVRT